jgi:hypothetical protein
MTMNEESIEGGDKMTREIRDCYRCGNVVGVKPLSNGYQVVTPCVKVGCPVYMLKYTQVNSI